MFIIFVHLHSAFFLCVVVVCCGNSWHMKINFVGSFVWQMAFTFKRRNGTWDKELRGNDDAPLIAHF